MATPRIGGPSLALRVEPVEDHAPSLSTVGRLLDELANPTVGQPVERHGLVHGVLLARGNGPFRLVAQGPVLPLTVVLGDATHAVDPGLLPALLLRVVQVEALADVASGP